MTNIIDTLFDELYKGLNDKINKEESIEHYFLTMNDNEIKKLAYLISEELEEDINLEDKKENLVNYIIVNLDPLVKGILKYCDDSTFDKFTKIPNYIEYNTEEEVLYIIDLFFLNAFHIAKANYNEKKDTITVFIHNEIKDLLDKYIKDKEIKKINKMYNKIYNTIELVLDTYGVISVDVFKEGEIVDVSGVSKGKGFQGVIKRYNQSRGPMGHGSQYHRGVGSLGTLLPMHVLKGKKLPGHMGNVATTIQNLEVVSVDLENNVILIKGNVPGPKKSLVMIKTSVKKADAENPAYELVSYDIEESVNDNIEVEDTKEETVGE